MLQFGTRGAGGSGSPDLWKSVGGTPNAIGLNFAAGAQAIQAALQSNPDISLILDTVASGGNPQDIAGALYQDNAAHVTGFSGLSHDTVVNVLAVLMTYIDQAAASQATAQVDLNQVRLSVKQTGSGITTYINLNQHAIEINATDVGGNNYLLANDSTGIYFQVNGIIKFKVTPTGQIETNQIGLRVAGVPNGKMMPIFNTAGTLQGYIQLYN